MTIWTVFLLCDELSPAVLTATVVHFGIRSLTGMGIRKDPRPNQSSTPEGEFVTLALKLFRGEPAISEFDWNFSANHSSSKYFATYGGSVLHAVLPTLQPGHG
jgi:hypothetical protein